jgi:transcriptional regulator
MRAEALKGHLDGLLLAVLEAGPAHGYAVIEALRTASGGTFDLPSGTVYPALRRLEEDGLVSSAWQEPSGERRRRVYELTARGRKGLAAQRESWQQFAGAVSAVMAGDRAWAPAP